MPPEEKVVAVKIGIISALKLLEGRLSETHEGMARRLGCTFSAYSKWLYGVNIPSGDWMLRILALCPDEETRNNFLDIVVPGSKIHSTPESKVPKEQREGAAPRGMRYEELPVKIPSARRKR